MGLLVMLFFMLFQEEEEIAFEEREKQAAEQRKMRSYSTMEGGLKNPPQSGTTSTESDTSQVAEKNVF